MLLNFYFIKFWAIFLGQYLIMPARQSFGSGINSGKLQKSVRRINNSGQIYYKGEQRKETYKTSKKKTVKSSSSAKSPSFVRNLSLVKSPSSYC